MLEPPAPDEESEESADSADELPVENEQAGDSEGPTEPTEIDDESTEEDDQSPIESYLAEEDAGDSPLGEPVDSPADGSGEPSTAGWDTDKTDAVGSEEDE